MTEYSILGKSIPRVDARVKVTGQAKYTGDLELPGMLWGKLLRSPYPHARILNIDTSRAERLPGVMAVVTGKDFGGFMWGRPPGAEHETPLAGDKVRYVAEGVAAVAAIDEDLAEEATELIKVDYEELPGVFDPFEAMEDDAPLVHENIKNNISAELHWHFGDVEKAFNESYLVREDRFRTGKVTQGFLEPSAALAFWDPSGHVTIWASKQSPRCLYGPLATCFKLPLSKVRIIQPFIGGGFGGTKNDALAGDFCAVMLSKKTGKPVKLVYSQEEHFNTPRRRHPMIIDMKTGVKRDGTLLAIHTQVVADGGAYVALDAATMHLAGFLMGLPYKLPNFKYDAFAALTNHPINSALRGFGVCQTRFAAEIQFQMIAEELGLDPVEIMLKNAVENPQPSSVYETVNKVSVATCNVKEAIEWVAESTRWEERRKGEKIKGNIARGMGISASAYITGYVGAGFPPSSAIIRVCEDGSVNLLTGATDAGQGSDTVLCMIAAEELGVAVEDIEIKRVDTAFTPCDPGTFGSRVTVFAGSATRAAAADAKRQLLEFAGKEWGVEIENIDIKDKKVFVKSDPSKGMSFSDLAKIAYFSGVNTVIIGRGYDTFEKKPMDIEKGYGYPAVSLSFCAQEAEVDVDIETGEVRCTDTTIVHDCGRALNPMAVEGQTVGGSNMGIGQALYEDFIMDKGKTLNTTFLDYRMPRSTDVPTTKIIDASIEDPITPFGAKECGEGSGISSPPAVVSAIHDATGIWFKELPVTPEKIWKALKERGSGSK